MESRLLPSFPAHLHLLNRHTPTEAADGAG